MTFKMKAIKQTERKTLVFEYHRSQAVTRRHAPQAFFGLLTADLEANNGHFLTVDTDDEFFRTLDIDVELMSDLASFALRSVAVSLDYGHESEPRSHRHDDLIFDAASERRQQWIVPIGPDFDLTYRPRVEFHFDPTSEWAAESNEVVFEPGAITDRTLQLDPTAHVGFLDVEVRPERLTTGDVTSVEVELTHVSSTGWSTTRSFAVQPDSAPQRWRVRTASEAERSYTTKLTYHLADGGTVVLEPGESSATTVAVSAPFASRLSRRVDFAIDNGTVTSVIIDVSYADTARNHTVQRQLELDGNNLVSTRVEFGIVDPSAQETTVQATLLGPNGAVVRGAPFVGTEQFLTIQPDGSISGA